VGIKVKTPDELTGAVDKALSSDEPVIVDIETDPQRFI
jgi:thiamine pyrophosphate-dependent acetolactate synthase large subunit-like protein